jgi:hypothetical protein
MANGQEYSLEAIDAAPESDELSDEIAKLLADKGIRVKRGESRTVCELWLCKQWDVDPEFKATDERLYPFKPGQLIGVLHFRRRGSEFRDQTVSSGWYTLRFGLQPVDGNHEGTSPTRDFLLLVNAEQDEFAKDWGEDELNEASAEAAGSSHPAMLCLQRPQQGSQTAIRYDEANDWWVLHTAGVAKNDANDVPIDLVVVGQAHE